MRIMELKEEDIKLLMSPEVEEGSEEEDTIEEEVTEGKSTTNREMQATRIVEEGSMKIRGKDENKDRKEQPPLMKEESSMSATSAAGLKVKRLKMET